MATGLLTTACLFVALSLSQATGWPANPRFDSAINHRTFHIPINIDPNRRHEIRELKLYVSTDLGRNWREVATATPDQDRFTYNAPTDGLYYFNLVVVYRDGRRDPIDVRAAPPAMRVLIDTLKPSVRINTAERQGDDVVVGWDVTEDNLDVATLVLEYRTADMPPGLWTPVGLNQASSGQARFRSPSSGPISLRIQATDQARNVMMAQAEVPPLRYAPPVTAAAFPPPPSPDGAMRTSTGYRDPVTEVSYTPSGPPSLPPTFPPPSSTFPSPPSSFPPPSPPSFPPPAAYDSNGRMVASSENNSCTPGGRSRGALPPLQIVNNPTVSLDYEVAHVGPSGVGRVELWLTQDDGRTWRRFAEDFDLKPPITVDLPGEGIFGFSLVVQSKAGLGKRPPLAGDTPELRIEVDTTSPTAKLYAPEPDPKRPNTLQISWSATDRNLIQNPITLQWAEKPNSTWETIGTDLPNTGRYTWQLPSGLPYRVYLRLVARDFSGNACVAETPEPVLVDLNEPEARLLGIAGALRRQ